MLGGDHFSSYWTIKRSAAFFKAVRGAIDTDPRSGGLVEAVNEETITTL